MDRLRDIAREIFFAGLKAVEPERAVKDHLKIKGDKLITPSETFKLSRFNGIYVVGGGKASASMSKAVEDILGDRISAGIVVTKYNHTVKTQKVNLLEADHPVPDEKGVEAAKDILRLLSRTTSEDLVVCLLSGGGSALLTAPVDGISLADKQRLTRVLLESGANIREINTLRKHLSLIKGGRLAAAAFPSTIISLILSDVVGDDLSTIASGPTYPDNTTFGDCLEIIKHYQLEGRIPERILRYITENRESKDRETPKEDHPAFVKTRNIIVGNNYLALKAAKKKAEEKGFNTFILSSFIEGETRDVAKVHSAIAREILRTGNPVKRPACILSGGETTVTIKGDGKGGRNQEFALASAIGINGLDGVLLLSAGTDGIDGFTDAAGAFANGSTIKKAREKGLDPDDFLRRNDSYNLFKPLNHLFITGPTITNVMDLRILLVT